MDKIIIYNTIPAIELIGKDIMQSFESSKNVAWREVSLNKLSGDKQGSTCVCFEVKDGEYRGRILKIFHPQDEDFLGYLKRQIFNNEFIGDLSFTGKSVVNKEKFNQYYYRFVNQINSMAEVQKVYGDRCLHDALELQVANTSAGLCFLCKKLKDLSDIHVNSINKSEKENILYDVIVKAFRQIQEIERIHNADYACLDVKPSNFCNIEVEKGELAGIRLVDYGSALNKESFYKYSNTSYNIFTSNQFYYLKGDLNNIVKKAKENDFDFSIVKSLDLKAVGIYLLSELNKYFVPKSMYDSEQLCANPSNLIKGVIASLSGVMQNYDLLELYFYLAECVEYLLSYENKPTCVEALRKLTKLFIKMRIKPDFIVGELDEIYNKEKQLSEAVKHSIQQFNHQSLLNLYKYSSSEVVLKLVDICIQEKINDMWAYLDNISKAIY